MLTNNTSAKHARRPGCAHCAGTGYVYLWSVPRVGSRVWFCDRGACKRFWSDTERSVPELANGFTNGGVTLRELLPLAATAEERVLQPV
jgi:hypothetical protein